MVLDVSGIPNLTAFRAACQLRAWHVFSLSINVLQPHLHTVCLTRYPDGSSNVGAFLQRTWLVFSIVLDVSGISDLTAFRATCQLFVWHVFLMSCLPSENTSRDKTDGCMQASTHTNLHAGRIN
jgi:hypothetical protein